VKLTTNQIRSILKPSGMLSKLTFSLIAVGTLGCVSALAGTATSNMSVTATVSNNCTITAGALSFGAYDPIGANASSPLNASATISVTCTSGDATTIALGQGSDPATGSTDAAPLRQMSDGASHNLPYQLYKDSGHSTVWNNTTGASYTGTGTAGSVTVYGQIAAAQNVPAASYSDTVVATITF
jgi:spore coat protein U-like protein